jgi:hypothetical protein
MPFIAPILPRPFPFVQKKALLAKWRTVAWFGACWVEHGPVLDKLGIWNSGKQVVHACQLEEYGSLQRADIITFGEWILKQDNIPSAPEVTEFLKRLHIRRYLVWSLLHPENDMIHPSKSMLCVRFVQT